MRDGSGCRDPGGRAIGQVGGAGAALWVVASHAHCQGHINVVQCNGCEFPAGPARSLHNGESVAQGEFAGRQLLGRSVWIAGLPAYVTLCAPSVGTSHGRCVEALPLRSPSADRRVRRLVACKVSSEPHYAGLGGRRGCVGRRQCRAAYTRCRRTAAAAQQDSWAHGRGQRQHPSRDTRLDGPDEPYLFRIRRPTCATPPRSNLARAASFASCSPTTVASVRARGHHSGLGRH